MFRVLTGYRQELKTVSDDSTDDLLREAEPTNCVLDADLPHRSRTHEYFVPPIGYCLPERLGNHLRLIVPPDKDMSVEQEPHSSGSNVD